ncbi:MAG: hypothetical protein KC431_03440 [Myxococcales bacterium]|nr:hypothetical protein [Myxococcales bacterium]MCA9696556.1 hypothetical protein [Myxococcales bacterium]
MSRFSLATSLLLAGLLALTGACSARDSQSGTHDPYERLNNFNKTVQAEVQAVAHAGDPEALHWVEPGAGVGLSCVDGRSDDDVLGSPGGDAGELLLLMAAAEQEGEAIDVAEVPALIDAWVETFGGFYMHTDSHALARLGQSLAADPRLAAALPRPLEPAALEAWLRSPPPELHEAVLAHIVDPNAVGCGHLASVLRAPEDYELRPELAGAVIMGFYRRLWRSPDDMRFVVLQGEHHEKAILDIEVAPGVDTEAVGDSAVPMIEPHGHNEQVFVVHPQAVAAFRARAVDLLVERHGKLDGEALATRVDALGKRQLQATLTHLHVDLPTIQVVVDEHHARSIKPL